MRIKETRLFIYFFAISSFCHWTCRAPTPHDYQPPSIETPLPADPHSPSPSDGKTPKPAHRVLSTEGAPSAREGHFTLGLGGTLLIGLGHNSSRDLNDVYLYDDELNTWQSLRTPDDFSPRFLAKAAYSDETSSVGHKAMVWGGARFVQITKEKGQRLGDGFLFDGRTLNYIPVTNQSPSIRDGHCLVFDGNESFIVWGGENENTPLGDGGVFHIPSLSWRKIPKESGDKGPEGREESSCYFHKASKKMLVYGGISSSLLSDFWSFDPETGKWEKLLITGDLISGLYRPTIAYSEEEILITGNKENEFLAMIIDLKTLTGRKIPSSPEGPGLILSDNLVAASTPYGFILSASLKEDHSLQSLWILRKKDPTKESEGYLWERLTTDGQSEFVGASLIGLNTSLISWGGRNINGSFNEKGLRVSFDAMGQK